MIGAIGVALAAVVVGATGFGFNLLAVPLLAIFTSAKEAVVVALVTGMVINSALAISNWRQVNAAILGTVLIGSIPGVAIGASVFVGTSEALLKLIIAVLTGLFAIQLITKPAARQLRISNGRLLAVGSISGILAATTGMGGPPLVAFLTQALSDPSQIRATIASYSAVSSLIALMGILLFGGVHGSDVLTGVIYVAPGLVGLVIGARLFSSRRHLYQRAVASILLVVAVIGISSAITSA